VALKLIRLFIDFAPFGSREQCIGQSRSD
jgi:hypothetical protein